MFFPFLSDPELISLMQVMAAYVVTVTSVSVCFAGVRFG